VVGDAVAWGGDGAVGGGGGGGGRGGVGGFGGGGGWGGWGGGWGSERIDELIRKKVPRSAGNRTDAFGQLAAAAIGCERDRTGKFLNIIEKKNAGGVTAGPGGGDRRRGRPGGKPVR